jgi:hypothetical protein
MLPGVLCGAILSLPGLLPALSLSRGVPADVALQASEIYVYQRLPHHLWPPGFVRTGIERFTMLSFVWLGMIALVPDNGRQAVIRRVVCAALLIAVAGGVIAASAIWYPAQAAQLLRYYWFRLADAMVPLGVALVGVATIARAVADPARQRAGRIALAATGIAVAVHLVTNFNEQQRLGVPRADGPGKVWNYADWRDACAWIEAETPTDALFLTPRSSQTFKWYAQRAEVITWKDVPQGAAEIVAWWQRMIDVYGTGDWNHRWHGTLADTGEAHVSRVAHSYRADFLLTSAEPPLALPCVYQNNSYAVYDLRPRPGK